jgi:hypothetical protein
LAAYFNLAVISTSIDKPLRLPLRPDRRNDGRMPALICRRYPERHDCWRVYYGDVQCGTIARRIGIAHAPDAAKS